MTDSMPKSFADTALVYQRAPTKRVTISDSFRRIRSWLLTGASSISTISFSPTSGCLPVTRAAAYLATATHLGRVELPVLGGVHLHVQQRDAWGRRCRYRTTPRRAGSTGPRSWCGPWTPTRCRTATRSRRPTADRDVDLRVGGARSLGLGRRILGEEPQTRRRRPGPAWPAAGRPAARPGTRSSPSPPERPGRSGRWSRSAPVVAVMFTRTTAGEPGRRTSRVAPPLDFSAPKGAP